MLVLSRRPGQSILIGRDIEIVVLGSDGVQVRVGIRAPREVTVLRRELLKQVEDENRRAVTTNLGAALGQLGGQGLGGQGLGGQGLGGQGLGGQGLGGQGLGAQALGAPGVAARQALPAEVDRPSEANDHAAPAPSTARRTA